MFIALLTLGLLASCCADVSHLGLSSGYQYESPQYNLNVPLHVPQQHETTVQVTQVEQKYLPPIQQNYASIPVPNFEPQPPVYNPEPVNRDYLPPHLVTETHQPEVQIPQYVAQQEYVAPVHIPSFVPQQEVQPQYQPQAPAPIYETQESQAVDFGANQQAFGYRNSYAPASQTGGYHYNAPNRRFRLK